MVEDPEQITVEEGDVVNVGGGARVIVTLFVSKQPALFVPITENIVVLVIVAIGLIQVEQESTEEGDHT